MRIIGLDPGLRHTGWGVVDSIGNRLVFISAGTISPATGDPLAQRLRALHDGLEQVIDNFTPDEAAIEETFVNRNASSTLKLGEARGVVLLVPARFGLTVSEYDNASVKKSVVGTGGASKDQVQIMVRTLLPEARPPSADAADALAVAICHAHRTAVHDVWQRAASAERAR